MATKTIHTKKALIEAMKKNLGVVTMACKEVGISRATYYDYIRKDEDFKAEIEDVKDVAIDFVESQLFKQIKEGSTAATIFYLKCQGKKRGYIEKQEVEHSGKVDNGGIIVKTASKEDIAEVKKLINGN